MDHEEPPPPLGCSCRRSRWVKVDLKPSRKTRGGEVGGPGGRGVGGLRMRSRVLWEEVLDLM